MSNINKVPQSKYLQHDKFYIFPAFQPSSTNEPSNYSSDDIIMPQKSPSTSNSPQFSTQKSADILLTALDDQTRKLKRKVHLAKARLTDEEEFESQRLSSSSIGDFTDRSQEENDGFRVEPLKNTSQKKKKKQLYDLSRNYPWWKQEHDKLAFQLSIEYRLDWKKIASKFQEKTDRKVSPRFFSQRYIVIKTQQNYQQKKLTVSDDLKICKLAKQYGDSWTQISLEMGNYDPIKIRNRYYYLKSRKNMLLEGEQYHEFVDLLE